jgi:hypothetical protein
VELHFHLQQQVHCCVQLGVVGGWVGAWGSFFFVLRVPIAHASCRTLNQRQHAPPSTP